MTPTLTEPTVGQLVAEQPTRAKVFERFSIDYCCGGKRPLSEVCAEKGLDIAKVQEALAKADAGRPAYDADESQRNWSLASMTDLCNHIESTHHIYVKRELPRIEQLLDKIVSVHGPREPRLAQLRDVFYGLRDEMLSHMMKEEQILFPMLRSLDNAEERPSFHCGSVSNPIRVMINEHENAGNALAQMRTLTDDYTPPADGCGTWRAAYAALHEFEQDLHQHVHKENNILFPKAERAEHALRG